MTISAGLSIGSLPMIWSSLGSQDGLTLRPSHVFGLLTLLLLLGEPTARLLPRTVALGALLGGLVVVGVVANAAWFDQGYWAPSEPLRFLVNLAIALGVSSVVVSARDRQAQLLVVSIAAGLAVALGTYVASIASTGPGVTGLLTAARRGDTRGMLFDVHLPALRWLHGSDVILGVRHGAIFGFIVAAALLLIVAERASVGERPVRWPRQLAAAYTAVIVVIAVLSLSRSAILALALGAIVWVAARRDEVLWASWTYIGAAMLVGVGITSLASGLRQRLFLDTESLSTRQVNLLEAFGSDWTLVGSPRLADGIDSPHNTLVEFSSAGGVMTLLGGVLIVGVVVVGLMSAMQRSPAVTLLAIVVLVRLLSAGRGSLDTGAMVALLTFVALEEQRRQASSEDASPAEIGASADVARASTSWIDRSSASSGSMRPTGRPLAPTS